MSKKHIRFCEQALIESKKSNLNLQHGSVITKGSKIIIRGYNNNRSTIKGKLCYCMHSEMTVIFDWLKICCKDIKNLSELRRKGNKYSLYITRNNKDITSNMFSMSKPCQMCSFLVKKCNFKKVIYTTGDNEVLKIVKPSQIENPILTSADNQYLKNIEIFKHVKHIIH